MGALGVFFFREADDATIEVRSPIALGEAEGDADVVLPGQLAHPADLRAGFREVFFAVPLADPERAFEDAFAAAAQHAADGQ